MSYKMSHLAKSTTTLKYVGERLFLPLIISFNLLASLPILVLAGNPSDENGTTTDVPSNTSHNEPLKAHWGSV